MYRVICRQVDENESEDVDTEEDRKDMECRGLVEVESERHLWKELERRTEKKKMELRQRKV